MPEGTAIRIGILADIHDDVDRVRVALTQFAQHGVEQVIVLGDTLSGPDLSRATELVELLEAAGARGVWGNHDIGLCIDLTDDVKNGFEPSVLRFMGTLEPHLRLDGCLFSHVEPWLDPRDVMQLWYFDGPPDTAEKAERSFAAVLDRFVFLGHFHHWLVTTPQGRVPWDGTEPIRLEQWNRCLVVIAPVCSGHCAVFDTRSALLTPLLC